MSSSGWSGSIGAVVPDHISLNHPPCLPPVPAPPCLANCFFSDPMNQRKPGDFIPAFPVGASPRSTHSDGLFFLWCSPPKRRFISVERSFVSRRPKTPVVDQIIPPTFHPLHLPTLPPNDVTANHHLSLTASEFNIRPTSKLDGSHDDSHHPKHGRQAPSASHFVCTPHGLTEREAVAVTTCGNLVSFVPE